MKEYITIDKAAEMLSVSIKTMYHYNRNRIIPYYKPSRIIYYKESDLRDFIEKGKCYSQKELSEKVKKDNFLKNKMWL